MGPTKLTGTATSAGILRLIQLMGRKNTKLNVMQI